MISLLGKIIFGQRVLCFYCNKECYVKELKEYVDNRNFKCDYCNAINHYDSNGKIVDEGIPMMHDDRYNTRYLNGGVKEVKYYYPYESKLKVECKRCLLYLNKNVEITNEFDKYYKKQRISYQSFKREVDNLYPMYCEQHRPIYEKEIKVINQNSFKYFKENKKYSKNLMIEERLKCESQAQGYLKYLYLLSAFCSGFYYGLFLFYAMLKPYPVFEGLLLSYNALFLKTFNIYNITSLKVILSAYILLYFITSWISQYYWPTHLRLNSENTKIDWELILMYLKYKELNSAMWNIRTLSSSLYIFYLFNIHSTLIDQFKSLFNPSFFSLFALVLFILELKHLYEMEQIFQEAYNITQSNESYTNVSTFDGQTSLDILSDRLQSIKV